MGSATRGYGFITETMSNYNRASIIKEINKHIISFLGDREQL